MSDMAACFLESRTVAGFFGSDEMRSIFNDRRTLQTWLDVEAALARSQAALGLIPVEAAAAISDAAQIDRIDLTRLTASAAATGHPLVPLVRALAEACGEPAGGFVHLGATTQDVMDTGYVLLARDGLAVVERQCQELSDILRRMAIAHRSTMMPGRTHGQQALPTTFGLRAAGWYEEMERHRKRLADLRPRLLVGSFGGAAGTLAGYGARALELRALVMRELGLGEPGASWHASQDRFAESVAVLGMIGSTAEKLAGEVYTLGRTEIAEAAEPQGEKQVGSSTMPHKRNPIRSEAVIAAASTLRAQVPLALQAMVAQDDRDMGSGMILWKLIPEAFLLIGGILERSIAVLGDLRVDPARMRHNLKLTGGLVASEAVMLRLAERIGRETAHHAVSEAAAQSLESGLSFEACLAGHEALSDKLTSEEVAALLDPASYLGAALEIVDRVVTGEDG